MLVCLFNQSTTPSIINLVAIQNQHLFVTWLHTWKETICFSFYLHAVRRNHKSFPNKDKRQNLLYCWNIAVVVAKMCTNNASRMFKECSKNVWKIFFKCSSNTKTKTKMIVPFCTKSGPAIKPEIPCLNGVLLLIVVYSTMTNGNNPAQTACL